MQYVASHCRPRLQSELGRWLDDCPRFGAVVAANQDKVRKKLNGAGDTSVGRAVSGGYPGSRCGSPPGT